MNYIARKMFLIYASLSSSVPSCRFYPSCSKYALDSIEKYGTLKGVLKAIKRLISCHPLTKRPVFDPA